MNSNAAASSPHCRRQRCSPHRPRATAWWRGAVEQGDDECAEACERDIATDDKLGSLRRAVRVSGARRGLCARALGSRSCAGSTSCSVVDAVIGRETLEEGHKGQGVLQIWVHISRVS